MSSNSHDTHTNVFSPDGRIFQIEYALKSVTLSPTALAIRTNSGIVFAVERRTSSPLRLQTRFERIMHVDDHAMACVAGHASDSKLLLQSARTEAQSHRFLYDEFVPLQALSESLSEVLINFGRGKKKLGRPFGCSLLIGGLDGSTPRLFCAEPSGSVTEAAARSLGAGGTTAQQTLQDSYREDMSLEDAKLLALEILRDVMESTVRGDNVEMATISYDPVNKVPVKSLLSEEDVKGLIAKLPATV